MKWQTLCNIRTFNSRPHEEVDKNAETSGISDLIFQFTTSRGGRHIFNGDNITINFFQFTTSRGGRPQIRFLTISKRAFQFTTSRGGRPIRLTSLPAYKNFQFTTSRGGRPFRHRLTSFHATLSIHDLTRRSTQQRRYSG